jgi:hypothetical protein
MSLGKLVHVVLQDLPVELETDARSRSSLSADVKNPKLCQLNA